MVIKRAPEWAYETFGAAALELGLYEEPSAGDEATRPQGAEAEPGPRAPWLMME